MSRDSERDASKHITSGSALFRHLIDLSVVSNRILNVTMKVSHPAVWLRIFPLALNVLSLPPMTIMSTDSLANFQVIQSSQSKNVQATRLMSMSFEEAGQLTIRFGESKLRQEFQDVVKEDQKYCQRSSANLRSQASQSTKSSCTF